MLFMATNRRIIDGNYGDEERPKDKYEYQYAYNKKKGEKTNLRKLARKDLKRHCLPNYNG
ncbi:MAG: hypothetical protein GY799_18770 [Desulfobulbaceae bacterium]|nr:hypothetical protein [Desulfobulbaceae bacterium]